MVSMKIDGVRAQLLFGHLPNENGKDKDYCAFIQRNGYVTYAPFFSKEASLFQGTLLDGEVVITKEENGKERLSYQVFDAIAVNGWSVGTLSLEQRLEQAKTTMEKICCNPSANIALKPFVEASLGIDECLEKLVSSNMSDGIILAPTIDGLNAGRLMNYYKYKPEHKITVDVKWDEESKTLRCGKPGFELVEELEDIFWVQDDFKTKKNGIYECIINRENEKFKLIPHHRRHDKPNANSLFVLQRTLQNIKEGITSEELKALFS